MEEQLLQEDEFQIQDEDNDQGLQEFKEECQQRASQTGRQSEISQRLTNLLVYSEQKSSFMASSVNIMNATLGAGILTMPLIIQNFGLILGIGIIVIAYILVLMTCNLLIGAKNLTKLTEYDSIGIYCFKKAGELTIKILIIIDCFGMVISYVIIFGQCIQKIMDVAVSPDDAGKFIYNRIFYQIIGCIIVSPFIYAKSTEKLKFTSFVCFGSIIFYLFVSFFNMCKSIHKEENHIVNYLPNHNFKFDEALSCFANIFVAFTFHFNFFPIFKALKDSSDSKYKKVLLFSQTTVMILYSMTGAFSFYAFGSTSSEEKDRITQANSLEYYRKEILGAPLYYMLYMAFAFVTISSVPINFFAPRNQLQSLIWPLFQKKDAAALEAVEVEGQRNTQQSDRQTQNRPTQSLRNKVSLKFFVIYATIAYSFCCLIGIIFTDLNILLAFVGAIAANMIVYILPAGFYLKASSMNNQAHNLNWKMGMIVVVFGFVAMIASLLGTILSLVKSKDEDEFDEYDEKRLLVQQLISSLY